MITKYFFLLTVFILTSCSTYKEIRPKNTSEYSQSKSVTKKYNRKYFKHWIDQDKDCKNTRAEVLEARSLKNVTYRKRKNGKSCTVHTGLWDDYYFNEQHTLASKVDIDHVVPLKHAWITGASNWSPHKRKKFANDAENLVITNKSYNRHKGTKTPLEWLPVDKKYACKYWKRWHVVKEKYSLLMSEKEYLEKANLCK